MTRTLLLLPLLTGCDASGLLSARSLEALYDVPPLPDEAGWELRWYVGPEAPLRVSCAPLVAEEVWAAVDPEVGEVNGGVAHGYVPEPPAPPFWIEEGAYRWAAAFVALVDRKRRDVVEIMEEEDAEDAADLLAYDASIWGASPDRAILYGEGDLERFTAEVVLVPEQIDDLFDGGVWVGMQPEIAEVAGKLPGSLYPLGEQAIDELDEEGLTIQSVDFLTDSAAGVLTGEAFGGITAEGCDR